MGDAMAMERCTMAKLLLLGRRRRSTTGVKNQLKFRLGKREKKKIRGRPSLPSASRWIDCDEWVERIENDPASA